MTHEEVVAAVEKIKNYILEKKEGRVYTEPFGHCGDYAITWVGYLHNEEIFHRRVISWMELESVVDPLLIAQSFIRAAELWEKDHLLKGETK